MEENNEQTTESTGEELLEVSEEQEEANELAKQVDKVALMEAILFVSAEPVTISRLCDVTGLSRDEVRESLDFLKQKKLEISSGTELVEVAGKFQLRTKAQFATFIRVLRSEKPKKLSAPALETLSIVAYRQPVVKSDIEKVRGVDTSPTIKTLLERNLIKIVGYQNTAGQPALYGTTEEFLKVFSLSKLSELPSLRDVASLEREPGESTEA